MLKNIYRPTFNKTKIIATIGPATSGKEMLEKIIMAGVDVCRINMSHGTHEDHAEVITNVREINQKINSNICILLDLQGPKLRLGEMGNDGVLLERGNYVTLTNRNIEGNDKLVPVRYEPLTKDVKPGERILLDDGNLELRIEKVLNEHDLEAIVVRGGLLKSRKGFNLPESDVSMPSLTDKDLLDLEFALKHGVEWIGLSFVRKVSDIRDLRERINASGNTTKIIAKIEKPEAVKNFDEILAIADGIMVARGDLGVEFPMEKVPLLQKDIVEKCLAASKPVIIATQMMESMILNSIPTRAEVTDVANAVLDGADAVMLSGETSVGKNPLKVVEIMEKIVNELEKDRRVYYKGEKPTPDSPSFLSDEICFTAVRMSDHIKAKAIAGMTRSGYTGYKVASFRPEANIYIFTDNHPLLNTMNLVWGVRGFYYDNFASTDKTFSDIIDILKERGIVEDGDRVIHTASMPIIEQARTNTIKISLV
jgi:pyruvate kinase